MKMFIQKHKVISAFGLIAIIIVVSYAVTYNMPDYLGIQGWYSLINNISISYIAALIFYILQIYKPELENSRRALTKLKPIFVDLIKFIEVTIECCNTFVNIEADGTIIINWTDKENKDIFFVIGKKDEERITARPPIYKTAQDIKNLEQVYRDKMNDIKSRIDFKYCNDEIANALSDLESTNFYNESIPIVITFENSFYKFLDFKDKVNELDELKNKFKQYSGISDEFTIRDALDMEIYAWKAIAHNDALKSQTENDFYENVIEVKIDEMLKDRIQNKEERSKLIKGILPQIMDNLNKK